MIRVRSPAWRGLKGGGVVLADGGQDLTLPEPQLIAELDHPSSRISLDRTPKRDLTLPEPQLIAERGYMTNEGPPPRIFPKQNKK